MENEEMNRFPLIGDKFPELAVQTTEGKKKIPGDYSGKWVVLFSHPADYTPVCTFAVSYVLRTTSAKC